MKGMKIMLFNLFKPLKTMDGKGITLYDIVNSDKVKQFPTNYFPFIQKTNSGIFICPRSKVISTNERYYIKYLVIKNCGAILKVVNDHNYPMVELPKDGFIAKFRMDFINIADRGYSLDWFIDYNNVSINQNVDKSLIRNFGSNNSQELNEQNKVSYSLSDDPNIGFIQQLSQTSNFFDEYLSDAIDKDGNAMTDIDYINEISR